MNNLTTRQRSQLSKFTNANNRERKRFEDASNQYTFAKKQATDFIRTLPAMYHHLIQEL